MPTLADFNTPLFSCWEMIDAIRLATAVSTKESITVKSHDQSTAMLAQYTHGEGISLSGILIMFAIDQSSSLMKRDY